ncbi:hypothetical protein PILCRDRAFT_11126 [Piloderma croceum F 1598]|uniref:High nitrogen upregulated cytochrome P450 monooxygenase 2 n=1 Tax=Piloderma croceum (strain F 1598) TaxID=765440 RepID=A0A0C3FEK1_PILCF|nr:hypothetical protein PILCRDRAFT_11126 [Piloderma croceum F 1598]
MSVSNTVSETYAAIARNLRFSDGVVLIVTYYIFKRFEPDKPGPVGFLLVVTPSILVPVLHLHILSLPLAITTTFSLYYSLILFYVATYRLSPFHPLAKYPGPITNKLSKLTMSYIASTGKQHTYYRKLHEHYGNIVRTGPNELSVNFADAIKPVLGAGGLPKGSCKSLSVFFVPRLDTLSQNAPVWYNRVADGQPSSIIGTQDPVEHKRRRKTWDRAFSTAAIRNYEEIVVRRARQLVEQFEKRAGQDIDLSTWMSFFSYDVMGDMTFGFGFDMMQTGYDANGVWKTIEGGLVLSTTLAHIPWLFTYLRLIPAITDRQRTFDLTATYVNHRIAEGSNIKDLMYYLTDEEGLEPEKPSMSIIHSDGLIAVIAGSDTTATSLTAILYYLLLEPAKFDRLRSEVDGYFAPGEEPLDSTKMASMPYLNASINEALRLVPPVISGSQRSATPGSGGKIIGPYFIPEGNNIFTHTHTLQRNPRYFSPYPDSFWPDRWLPEKDREKAPFNEEFILDLAAFNPFSYGPANCVGKNLALLELRVITCFIVQKFNLKVKQGFRIETWEEGIEDFFVVKRPPLPVIMEARRF